MNRAELTERYNDFAAKLGRKTVKSFKDLPTAKARAAAIEKEYAATRSTTSSISQVDAVKNSPLQKRLTIYGLGDDTEVRVVAKHNPHQRGAKARIGAAMLGYKGTLGEWKRACPKDILEGDQVWTMANQIRNGYRLFGIATVEFKYEGRWYFFNDKGEMESA